MAQGTTASPSGRDLPEDSSFEEALGNRDPWFDDGYQAVLSLDSGI